MKRINRHEIKTHFSKLVDSTMKREEVIAMAEKAVAKLTSIEKNSKGVLVGGLKRKIKNAKDFNDPLPEAILSSFEECL